MSQLTQPIDGVGRPQFDHIGISAACRRRLWHKAHTSTELGHNREATLKHAYASCLAEVAKDLVAPTR